MDRMERLEAIEEIKQLKGRYVRALDTKDWALFESVWTDDAVFDFREGRGTFNPANILNGRRAIVERMQKVTPGMTTVHHIHSPEIEILSETTAHGTWALEDMSFTDTPDAAGHTKRHAFGHYHEEYRREGGVWRVAHGRVSRLRVSFT